MAGACAPPLEPGYIPIPKSINPQRVLLNMADGFDLTESQMELGTALRKSLFFFSFVGVSKKKGTLYNELSALGGTLGGDVFFEIGRVVIKLKRGIVLPCPALSVFFAAWLHPGQLTAGSPEFITLSV